MSCEPPTILRQTIKSYTSPCPAGQIDRNGSCFEPQTFSYGAQGPIAVGCGCVRKTLAQRVQCPSGYEKYNNGCVSKCPAGFTSILDSEGQIASMYCTQACPKVDNSSVPWQSLGQLCVKPLRKRLQHLSYSLGPEGQQLVPNYGLPNSVLNTLSHKPLGSSVNDRVRTGQSVGASNSALPGSSFLKESWSQLFSQPIILLSIIGLVFILRYLGPPLFRGLGSLLKSVATSAGTLVEGAADLGKGALEVGAATENQIASLQRRVSSIANTATAESNNAAAQVNLNTEQIRQQIAELQKQLAGE